MSYIRPHIKRIGRCGHVLLQCRCPGTKRIIRDDVLCPSCLLDSPLRHDADIPYRVTAPGDVDTRSVPPQGRD